MYAHSSPDTGKWIDADGVERSAGQNFRTLERWKEYKACGLDTLWLGGNNYFGQYPGDFEDFEDSQMKKNLDMAEIAGLKVLMMDLRILRMSECKESLIGSGKCEVKRNPPYYTFDKFKDFDALVKYVEACTRPYRNHPAFLGMNLSDEAPYAEIAAGYGMTYNALKAVDPDMAVRSATVAFCDDLGWIPHFAGADSGIEKPSLAYKKYVKTWFKLTGADMITIDSYPFRAQRWAKDQDPYIFPNALTCLQKAYRESKANGGRYDVLIQSWAAALAWRTLTEADIRWQLNMALGFGAANLHYFIYWMKPNHKAEGDFQAIMDHYGNKMLYDEVRRCNAETQALAKIILNYDYQKTYTAFFGCHPPNYFYGLDEAEKLDHIQRVKLTVGKETADKIAQRAADKVSAAAIVNQLYDKEKNLYGYFSANATDPVLDMSVTVTLTFERGYKRALTVRKGVCEYVEITDSRLGFDIEPGGSCFVVPYK